MQIFRNIFQEYCKEYFALISRILVCLLVAQWSLAFTGLAMDSPIAAEHVTHLVVRWGTQSGVYSEVKRVPLADMTVTDGEASYTFDSGPAFEAGVEYFFVAQWERDLDNDPAITASEIIDGVTFNDAISAYSNEISAVYNYPVAGDPSAPTLGNVTISYTVGSDGSRTWTVRIE